MKNHIAIKFIAIVLCAASLMGAVGSITGVAVLTSSDLYNKTVEQVKEERVQQDVEYYSDKLALMYASAELGGCPENMVWSASDQLYWFESAYGNYGYSILDADGKVVSSYNPELKDSAPTYTVTASGQYMHLVSQESQAEIEAREAQAQVQRDRDLIAGNDGSTVPEEGIGIDRVTVLHSQGWVLYEAYYLGNGQVHSICYDQYGNSVSSTVTGYHVGYLHYATDGRLIYNSFLTEDGYSLHDNDEGFGNVGEVVFTNDQEGFFFSLSDYENIVGRLSNESGRVRFVSNFAVEPEEAAEPAVVAETVPEETSGWVVETIPGSEDTVNLIGPDGTSVTVSVVPTQEAAQETLPVEETIPEETAAAATEDVTEETAAAETVAETVPSSASAVPVETEATESVVETTVPTVAETIPAETTVQETIPAETVPAETIPEETLPEVTEPVLINGKTLDNYQINTQKYYDQDSGQQMTAKYVYVPMPELTVEMYIDKDSMRDNAMYDLLATIRQFRSYLLPAIGVCLLIFAVLTVYLCTAAGRSTKSEEVRAGGLNRMPLDLYLFGGCFAIACIAAVGVEATEQLLRSDFILGCGFAVAATFLACLIFVGFCFAFVAQIKTPNGFWWKNTLCGICIRGFMRFAVWFENFLSVKGYPWLGRTIKKLWQVTCKSAVWLYHAWEKAILWIGNKLGILFHWVGGKIHRFFSLLPLTWQWLIAGAFTVFLLFITVAGRFDAGIVLSIIFAFALILYASHCFGLLSESTKRMSKGDLDTKVEDKLMAGCFKEFAGDLNALADVAVVAAQKQLKSERMKTELITNVSHDIKTPLTSIINYVDLLQKPHTAEEEAQYLEVLDRQSQRLKKLIDDLMDMSKASTGNMAVEITTVDAVESVNQALGEFADKLDKAHLIPVFRHDDARVPMMADGKLVWRVMSNLLSNAVKYAMPGTRLYIDLMTLEGKVIISLKNISREELNVDADELMERFVRGDDSRNTEGSGLGLNIAKSLMELQKGQLQLLVDGDLFKVTLIFPGV